MANPSFLQRKHGKPFFYYDGDVPASLPNMSGFASGFRIYQGADPGEYAAVISNSKGGESYLKALGAKQVHTVYWGVDTEVFSPISVPAQDLDVMFYGHGKEYRAQWVEDMLAGPSRALPEAKFAVRGTQLGDLGRTQLLPYLSFSKLREYACRSKINLCITPPAAARSICVSHGWPTLRYMRRRPAVPLNWRRWAAAWSPIPIWESRNGSNPVKNSSLFSHRKKPSTATDTCFPTRQNE